MRNTLLLTTLIVCTAKICLAQADTTTAYFNRANKETYKDSAYVYVKFSKKDDNLWFGKAHDAKTNALKFEGTYAEKDLTTPLGAIKTYNDDGMMDYVTEYVNGKAVERTWYYKNGNKRSWIFYSDNKPLQKGWDEAGKEIKDYVVEREARFKSGLEGWKRFLEKTLNASVAVESGAPKGMYTVKIQFIVSKEGYVSNVKAIEVPAGCKPCAKEAVAVLTASPAWEPAIQNNVPVIYQAIQHITFQVAAERKRGRGN